MNGAPSHQTVKLSRGRHDRPEDGMCVMELASVLAGGPFTDQPRSVSPVIGAFLRTYNDVVDQDRRADLYRYAAKAVGTRRKRTLERHRAARCLAVSRSVDPWLGMTGVRERIFAVAIGYGKYAGRTLGRSGAHAEALALIDELVRMGGTSIFPDTAPPSWREVRKRGAREDAPETER